MSLICSWAMEMGTCHRVKKDTVLDHIVITNGSKSLSFWELTRGKSHALDNLLLICIPHFIEFVVVKGSFSKLEWHHPRPIPAVSSGQIFHTLANEFNRSSSLKLAHILGQQFYFQDTAQH